MESNLVPLKRVTLVVVDEAHRATGNYSYCKLIEYLEKDGAGFRILALSATPVSKIENLQTIIQSLRCSKLEVRDEDDAEVRKYTHDKNIVEIIVDKEDGIHVLETHINSLMELCLGFLKQAKLVSPQTAAKFVNKMTVINMQDDVRAKQLQGAVSLDFVGAVFTRTSVLISLCHAKKLLATHGYESFTEYITGFFDLTKKDKKNVPFLKHLKE
jgi:ATP-dependent DNA helicase MPH1